MSLETYMCSNIWSYGNILFNRECLHCCLV